MAEFYSAVDREVRKACLSAAPAQSKPEQHLLLTTASLRSGGEAAIHAERLRLKTNTMFLEHYDVPGTDTPVVLSLQDADILESQDLGKTWKRYEIGLPVLKAFIMRCPFHGDG